jgi:hypothetical protein
MSDRDPEERLRKLQELQKELQDVHVVVERMKKEVAKEIHAILMEPPRKKERWPPLR